MQTLWLPESPRKRNYPPELLDRGPNAAASAWGYSGDGNGDVESLAQAITASGRYLEGKYGILYPLYLEQAVSLLELTMQQHAIDSPIVAAVNLGAEGGFSATVSDDDDAFRILVQGALRILISGVLSEKSGHGDGAVV